MPVKMTIGIAPRFDMLAHTFTSYGCLTMGFNLAAISSFLKQILLQWNLDLTNLYLTKSSI